MNACLFRSIRGPLLLIVGLATAVAWAPRANAACPSDPVPALWWSYPAQGAVGIPTNTRVWLASNGTHSVVFEGIPAEMDREVGGHILPLLNPGTTYTVEVLVTSRAGGATTSETLTFTTGSGPVLDAPEAPAVSLESVAVDTGLLSYGLLPDGAAFCDAVHEAAHCYDGGQNTVVSFRSSSTPVFWFLGPSRPDNRLGSWWPGSCGQPEVVVLPWQDCVSLQAVNAAGMTSPVVELCLPGKEPQPVDPASGGGCSSGLPWRGPPIALLAPCLLAALIRRAS